MKEQGLRDLMEVKQKNVTGEKNNNNLNENKAKDSVP